MSASSSFLPGSSPYGLPNTVASATDFQTVGPTKTGVLAGVAKRWRRERRRRKVGRAFDMALEIARLIPAGSQVLDVGCGNGYIAHHLGGLLGRRVTGIDLGDSTEAPIRYQQFDGRNFPVNSNSHDAALLCYVLHHTQDFEKLAGELRRTLRDQATVIVYEDIPASWWDRVVCAVHDRMWRNKTGPCTFRRERAWRDVFATAGFELISERRLSRLRNLAHPVRRQLFVFRKKETIH